SREQRRAVAATAHGASPPARPALERASVLVTGARYVARAMGSGMLLLGDGPFSWMRLAWRQARRPRALPGPTDTGLCTARGGEPAVPVASGGGGLQPGRARLAQVLGSHRCGPGRAAD